MGLFWKQTNCCGLYTTKTGSWIIGICDIIFTSFFLFYGLTLLPFTVEPGNKLRDLELYGFAQDILYISLIILYFIVIVFSILMVLLGFKKKKPLFIRIWLMHEIINTVVYLLLILSFSIDEILQNTSKSQTAGFSLMFITFLWIPMKWYLLSIVNSYCLSLMENNQGFGEFRGQENTCVVNP